MQFQIESYTSLINVLYKNKKFNIAGRLHYTMIQLTKFTNRNISVGRLTRDLSNAINGLSVGPHSKKLWLLR